MPIYGYRCSSCGFEKDVMQKISLINDPRNEYRKLYTVDKLNNMVGGVPIRYVNLPSEELAKYAAKAIDNDIPVWFGCDAAKFGYGADGIYSDESECSNGRLGM